MKSTQTHRGEKQENGAGDEVDRDADTVDDESLPIDDVFHLLQNERRRLVLEYLRNTEEPVRMRDVAEQVAAWEHDTTVQQLTSTQRQRVYIPLYQSHLSKLDTAGVIDYQQSRGIIERKPLADQLEPYLEPTSTADAAADADASSWDGYSVAATSLGTLLLLGSVLELPLFSVLSGIGLSALVLLVFTLLTVGQYIDR